MHDIGIPFQDIELYFKMLAQDVENLPVGPNKDKIIRAILALSEMIRDTYFSSMPNCELVIKDLEHFHKTGGEGSAIMSLSTAILIPDMGKLDYSYLEEVLGAYQYECSAMLLVGKRNGLVYVELVAPKEDLLYEVGELREHLMDSNIPVFRIEL